MPKVSMAALIAGARSGDWAVSFPTDTVPALAARPDRADLIFKIKQRRQDKPLILMGANLEALQPFIKGTSEETQAWYNMAQQHWPGALTLVIPARHPILTNLNPEHPTTIGIRVPNSPVAQAVLQQTGPLATSSVNLSGQRSLERLDDIDRQFPQILTLVRDLWSCPAGDLIQADPGNESSGVPSTVVRWSEAGWQVLRQGAVQL